MKNKNQINTMSMSILRNCSDTAFKRMQEEARYSHQSVQTIARRRVSNMLRSYKMELHTW